MLKTDSNVKCVKSYLQLTVPTPELQILDLQVLVATLKSVSTEHCFDMYSATSMFHHGNAC